MSEERKDRRSSRIWAWGGVLVALASSLVLCAGHLGAIATPGCGPRSACAEAAASLLGSVPGIGWPTSFVGAAFFGAVAVSLLRGPTPFLHLAANIGALASLILTVALLAGTNLCPYCLAVHAGNFVFWRALRGGGQRPAGPRTRGMGLFLVVFAVLTGLLFFWQQSTREDVRERDEEALRGSEQEIAAGGGDRAFSGRYALGPERSPARLVLFTDYQCSDCRAVEGRLAPLLEQHPDVRFSVKHLPYSTTCNPYAPKDAHPDACWSAYAAETAGELLGAEGFFEFHRWLFAMGGRITTQAVAGKARELGADPARFREVMHGEEIRARVVADIEEAHALGVDTTPTLFINGVELRGWRTPGAIARGIAAARESAAAEDSTGDRPPEAIERLLAGWRAQREVRIRPDPEEGTYFGRPDAPVQMVAWVDLREPNCARFLDALTPLIETREDLGVTLMHYPLSQTCNVASPVERGADRCRAAYLTAAAGRRGGPLDALEMARAALRHDGALDAEWLARAAEPLGADPADLERRAAQPELQAAVRQGATRGASLGVQTSPAIFVQGRFVPRWIYGDLDVLGAVVAEAAGE